MILNKLFLHSNILLLGIFIILAWFLFTYKLTEVPPGINGDEAHIGYNAKLVSMTGYDQNGRLFPVFVSTKEGGDWKQPVTFYSVVLTFKIFHSSYFVLRAVSVFYTLVSLILFFFLVKDILGEKAAFISFGILLTTPILMIQSHLALENIAPLPFVILWLLFLYRYQKNKKADINLFLSGLSLAVSTYTYFGMRLMVPTLTSLSIGYIYLLNKKNLNNSIKGISVFLIPVFIILVATLLFKNVYPGAIFGNNRPGGINSYQGFFLPFISNFDPSFLYITGDITPYHSTGNHGVLLLATLPIFLLGLMRIIKSKDSFLIFVVVAFLTTPLLYGLVSSVHRGSRLLALLPFYSIISTVGLSYLSQGSVIIKRGVFLLILALLALNYFDFLNDYWYQYPQRVTSNFAKPMHLAFERALIESREKGLKPYLETDFYAENPTASDFFKSAYFDDKIENWDSTKEIPEKSIVIGRPEVYSKLDSKRIKYIDLGTPYYSLFIRENE